MKKIKIAIAAVIFATTSLFAPVSANAEPTSVQKSTTSLIQKMPFSIVVKQTAKLSDGRNIIVYYKKDSDFIELYSKSNLKGYQPAFTG